MLNEFSANPLGLASSCLFLLIFPVGNWQSFRFLRDQWCIHTKCRFKWWLDDHVCCPAPQKNTDVSEKTKKWSVEHHSKHSEGGPLLFPILPPVIRQRRSARTLLTKRKNLSAYDQQWCVSSAWKRTWGQINSNCQIFRNTTEVMYTTRFAW